MRISRENLEKKGSGKRFETDWACQRERDVSFCNSRTPLTPDFFTCSSV